MQRIAGSDSNSSGRSVYKITRGREEFIFKSVSCLLEDETTRNYLREDFDVQKKSSGEGVVEIIDDREHEDKETGEFVIEVLYEYFGENLLLFIRRVEEANDTKVRNIMNMMTSVALTMKRLQELRISHGDLKPENMVTRDGIVKLIDFGLAREFSTASQLGKSITEKGRTKVYSPPEIIRNPGKTDKHPVKIDVFCWGMSLYQLITGKSISDLEEEYNLRAQSKDYPKFLKKIENIEIEANNLLKLKVRKVLLYVLNERHEDRPTFKELCELLEDERRIEDLKRNARHENLIKQVAKNNEGVTENHSELCNRLFNELQQESKERYEKVKSAYNCIRSGVTSCNLHSVCIGDTGAMLLAFALNESRNLKELNLGFNKIQVNGIKALAEGLKGCHTLETLILGKPRQREEKKKSSSSADASCVEGGIIGGFVGGLANGVAGAAIVGLKKSIAVRAGLAILVGTGGGSIVFIGACIGVATQRLIVRLCNSNESPEPRIQMVDDPELDKSNNLGTIGTKAIADYLRGSKLKHIDLSYCNISSDAFLDLVEAANACQTLVRMNIEGNSELGRQIIRG